jgi:hypothetical protein
MSIDDRDLVGGLVVAADEGTHADLPALILGRRAVTAT